MSQASSSLDLTNPLVTSLNALLHRLELPLSLETPLDLTPFLLLAMLESLLETRLPISQTIRESKSINAKVEAMKIFLGVLENDVLGIDVGLSDIDPRRLASGSWEEVVFVGKLLCWLGRRMGLLDQESSVEEAPPKRPLDPFHGSSGDSSGRIHSPSTRSTVTTSMNSALSIDDVDADSNTTILSALSDLPETPRALSMPLRESSPEAPRSRAPQCIHEIEDPSFIVHPNDDSSDNEAELSHHHSTQDWDGSSYCRCLDDDAELSLGKKLKPIRCDAWMEQVDSDIELQAFESSRSAQSGERSQPLRRNTPGPRHVQALGDIACTPTPRIPVGPGKRLLTRHTSPTQHTLALLNERARILSDLAGLKLSR